MRWGCWGAQPRPLPAECSWAGQRSRRCMVCRCLAGPLAGGGRGVRRQGCGQVSRGSGLGCCFLDSSGTSFLVSQFPSRWPPPLSQPPGPKPIAVSSLYTREELRDPSPASRVSPLQSPARLSGCGVLSSQDAGRSRLRESERWGRGWDSPAFLLLSTAQNREQPYPESAHLRGKNGFKECLPWWIPEKMKSIRLENRELPKSPTG